MAGARPDTAGRSADASRRECGSAGGLSGSTGAGAPNSPLVWPDQWWRQHGRSAVPTWPPGGGAGPIAALAHGAAAGATNAADLHPRIASGDGRSTWRGERSCRRSGGDGARDRLSQRARPRHGDVGVAAGRSRRHGGGCPARRLRLGRVAACHAMGGHRARCSNGSTRRYSGHSPWRNATGIYSREQPGPRPPRPWKPRPRWMAGSVWQIPVIRCGGTVQLLGYRWPNVFFRKLNVVLAPLTMACSTVVKVLPTVLMA